ncbi:hypothetical protein CcaCcLH18_05931 [Colletotrichum camelliae]|nr:hypothetical protein CcaCcLH18_05931 [Colletotrichum camelliae]
MDFASLVHQSPMLQCPDFWLQCPSDTEDQLRAQVMLANRVYRYGVYKGHNENEYIGISAAASASHLASNTSQSAKLTPSPPPK